MKIFIFLFMPRPALIKLRCIPSPASKSMSSLPLMSAIEDSPRSMVGVADEVPKKMRPHIHQLARFMRKAAKFMLIARLKRRYDCRTYLHFGIFARHRISGYNVLDASGLNLLRQQFQSGAHEHTLHICCLPSFCAALRPP